jgi:dolichyl-phosphate beta-glucosyltransferase
MSNQNPQVLLVIPCYNEALRLKPAGFTAPAGIDLTLVFCDDGSSDNTSQFLKDAFRGNLKVKVIRENVNVGKAEVIRRGMLWSQSNLNLSSFDWIGFWDADLATPLSELPRMLALHNMDESKAEAVIASRVGLSGANIRRKASRHYLGRIFVTVADFLLGIKVYDSQCGAKLFRPRLIEKAFNEPFLSRWIFDLEVILRIGSENIYEVPLKNWEDVPGSKVKIFRESFRVLSDLFRLKRHYNR